MKYCVCGTFKADFEEKTEILFRFQAGVGYFVLERQENETERKLIIYQAICSICIQIRRDNQLLRTKLDAVWILR